MHWITFAIAHSTPTERREGVRERVATRFGGYAETTELVGVRDFGRLYRMREIERS